MLLECTYFFFELIKSLKKQIETTYNKYGDCEKTYVVIREPATDLVFKEEMTIFLAFEARAEQLSWVMLIWGDVFLVLLHDVREICGN